MCNEVRRFPWRNIPPRQRQRVNNLTEENQSLINSFRSTALTPQETETRLQSLSNLMTSSEEQAEEQFRLVISALDGDDDLRMMAELLTSNSDDYFLDIARNKNGSIRLQKLLGKSDDVDTFFFDAILRCFSDVMTNTYAFFVVIHGMRVFSPVKKTAMCSYTINNVIPLACDRQGCKTLKYIINDLDNPFYRNQIVDAVTLNARVLSYDAFGSFVVQHVLELYDLGWPLNVADSLQDRFVHLSFNKYGSYIVEKLLETEVSRVRVVEELLRCNGDGLMRLAMSVYGNYVVVKALKVTRDETMNRLDLFWGLVNKLRPSVNTLRRSRGYNIALILESVS